MPVVKNKIANESTLPTSNQAPQALKEAKKKDTPTKEKNLFAVNFLMIN